MCISLCYIQNAHVLIINFILFHKSHYPFSEIPRRDDSTPQDVESPNASKRFGGWLWIRIGDIDEMSNGDVLESNYLRLLGKFVSKIKNENNRNIDVRGDKSLGLPAIFRQQISFGIVHEKGEKQGPSRHTVCV